MTGVLADIAELVGTSRALVLASVARLVAAGLVEGVGPLGIASAHLTEKARPVLASIRGAQDDFVAACRTGLPDDQAPVADALARSVLDSVRARLGSK